MFTQKEFLAKGKRGITYTAMYRGKRVLIKEKNPSAVIDTTKHEARMLQILNKHNIGPKFIAYTNRTLVREYIEGKEILEYLKQASKKEIIRVLTEIFYQCYKMDLLGINKLELTRPYKHILISKKTKTREEGEVVQIDFERCKETPTPKNVTQFAQCVTRGHMQEIFAHKKITIRSNNLSSLTKKYKQNYNISVFEEIIKAMGGSPRTPISFTEQVYDVCSRVPKGKVINYRGIAHAIGTNAYQAIGQALKRNPYAPRVPCHRVVRNDGSIGGFMGSTSGTPIAKKKRLLAEEGVEFVNGKLKDMSKMIDRI